MRMWATVGGLKLPQDTSTTGVRGGAAAALQLSLWVGSGQGGGGAGAGMVEAGVGAERGRGKGCRDNLVGETGEVYGMRDR